MKKYIVPKSSAYKLPFFLLFTIFLTALQTNAQVVKSRRKENSDVHRFTRRIIKINPTDKIANLSNFSSITVLDERPDTARVGLFKMDKNYLLFSSAYEHEGKMENVINANPAFIVMEGGLHRKLESYANTVFDFSHNDSLHGILMLVKKFWIADEPTPKWVKPAKIRSFDSVKVIEPNVFFELSIEFYLRNGEGYFAMYKYDTLAVSNDKTYVGAKDMISDVLMHSLAGLQHMDGKIDLLLKKRKFYLNEIKEHAETSFNVPILKDSILQAGVYLNFEDFKANRPSHTQFEITKGKLADDVYILQPGGQALIDKNVWGYCDGKDIYIRSANNFFILQRLGNAYYIFGSKEVVKTLVPENNYPYTTTPNNTFFVTPGRSVSQGKFMVVLKAFYLDWETGVLY